MKNTLYIFLLFVLVACEDRCEISHQYSKQYFLNKNYPIWLDISDMPADIQVKPPVTPNAAFKIVSNDRYFFVGEKMNGIHVFEKTGKNHAHPLCFIECKYIKAFDVLDNILYCNNFVDLLCIDVEDPLQAKIRLREKKYFNGYSEKSLNLPYQNETTYLIGYKRVELTGIETDKNPAPDFSEYDKLYGNIIVKEIPESLQTDKPFAGFARIEHEMYTFGDNSLAVCSCSSDGIIITQSSFFSPYYNYFQLGSLLYRDGMIYIVGLNGFEYMNYHWYPLRNAYHSYGRKPLDIVALKNQANSFVILYDTESCIQGITTTGNYTYNSMPSLEAVSLMNIRETIFALGKQLTLYRYNLYSNYPVEIVKQYPDISGSSMMSDGNTLIVAGKQGLLFYDISDLENIILLP